MTCAHGISVIYGVKISKSELVRLLFESNIKYDGKDYDSQLMKIKEEHYRKYYNDFVKEFTDDDCEPPTYEEYIHKNLDMLNDVLFFVIDNFKFEMSNEISLYDFDFSDTSLTFIVSNHEEYRIGFNIGNYNYHDSSVMINEEELSNFKDNYKAELEELREFLPENSFNKATIMAVMSGCGCCS